MKIGDTLQKIYNSFDFRGNRIKRLRVDTPSETPDYRQAGYEIAKDFVANKEYVDKCTTYDTPKAYKYKNPFKQWWMKNVQGLPYKELLDDLLFPRLKPIYVDPTVDYCKITVFDSSLVTIDNYKNKSEPAKFFGNLTNTKYVIYAGQTVEMRFSIGTTPNDRISGVAGEITVYDSIGTKLYGFNSDATNDSYSNIKCRFIYQKDYRIIFTKKFTVCPVKNDSYNEPSPVDAVNYTLTYDVTEQFERECFICDSILTYKSTTEGILDTDLSKYLVSNKCIFSAEQDGLFNIAIPEQLNIQEYQLLFEGYSITETKSVPVVNGNLTVKQIMGPGTTTITKQVFNGITYSVFQFNFGYFGFDVEIVLTPKHMRLTA